MSVMLSREWLRVHVGVLSTDASKDAEIDLALATALAIADTYCNRKFLYAIDQEIFTHTINSALTLRRYPIASIDSVLSDSGASVVFKYHAEAMTGLLHLDAWAFEHVITVDYTGGYWINDGTPKPVGAVEFPADLSLALVEIFDAAWYAQHRTLAQGGVAGMEDAKQIRAGDLSITFDNADSGASVDNGFGDLLPLSAAGILDRYERRTG